MFMHVQFFARNSRIRATKTCKNESNFIHQNIHLFGKSTSQLARRVGPLKALAEGWASPPQCAAWRSISIVFKWLPGT